jgi:phosphatidylglycerol:prolipoprotein diacylglycerol transferase
VTLQLSTGVLPDGVAAPLAIAVTAELAARRARSVGLRMGAAATTFLAALAGGLLAGHALFAATHGVPPSPEWLRFWGGQSVFGVLAGGTLAAGVWLHAHRLPLLRYADAAAPAVAIGYAVARLGCLLQGDDFGVVTTCPWGITYPAGTEAWAAHASRGWIPPEAAASLPVVPVQLLLAVAGVAAAVAALRAAPRRTGAVPGSSMGAVALIFGMARFAAEPLRDDFTPVAGPLSLPQALALAAAIAGALLVVRARFIGARSPGTGTVSGPVSE